MSRAISDIAPADKPAPAPAGFVLRIFNRIAEARMRRALYEIRRHRHLFERHPLDKSERRELPFE